MSNVVVMEYNDFNKFCTDILPNGKFGTLLSTCIFRGESSSKYRLIPSALRPEGREKLRILTDTLNGSDFNFGYIIEEIGAIRAFYNTANKQGLYLPNINEFYTYADYNNNIIHCTQRKNQWIPIEFMELFALAQHYGVPTRLLDWTFDIYIALYFSSIKIVKSIMHENNINLDNKFVIWMLNIGFNSLIVRNRLGINIIVPPYNNNMNITAQKGVFTSVTEKVNLNDKIIGFNDLIPFDKYINDSKEISQSPVLYKILFPHTEALKVFTYLQHIGYTHSTVFPGYAEIIEDISERKIWGKLEKLVNNPDSNE